jgi:hypothetical protein
MSVFNDNNGPVLATGTVCTIEPINQSLVPATVSSTGGDTQVFEKVSWFILGDASAAGTVALQLKDATGSYHTCAISPFPVTLAANQVTFGNLTTDCHGAQFVVTLSGGTLLVCELVGQMRIDE